MSEKPDETSDPADPTSADPASTAPMSAPAASTSTPAAEQPREDRRQQPKPKATQTMKPETAAKKLSIYLPATPESFRSAPVTRDQLNAMLTDPPEWLVALRASGPHPRSEVSRRLGISNSGLARHDQPDVMTTAEIKALLEAPPAWLVEERSRQGRARDRD
jgi:hypothetical protein